MAPRADAFGARVQSAPDEAAQRPEALQRALFRRFLRLREGQFVSQSAALTPGTFGQPLESRKAPDRGQEESRRGGEFARTQRRSSRTWTSAMQCPKPQSNWTA